MKKSNILLQAAVTSALLAMSVGAQAGNMATTTRYFASENFGSGAAATVAFTPAATSYAVSSAGGVTLATGQSTNVYLRVSNGTVNVAPVVGDFSGIAALGAASAPAAVANNSDTIVVTYTNTTAASVNLPVNTTVIWTPAASALAAKTSAMSTAGGAVSVTGSMDGGVVNLTATTLPTSQDPIAAPVNVALSAQAITGGTVSSASYPTGTPAAGVAETKKIDLASGNGTATTFVNGATTNTSGSLFMVNLGSYSFTNNASVTPTTPAGVNYALGAANAATGAIFNATKVSLSPGAGESFTTKAVFDLYSDSNCATSISSGAVTITTANQAGPITLTTAGAAAVPGTKLPMFICMTIPNAPAYAVVTPFTASATVSLTKTVTSDAANTVAATSLYPLGYNGTQIDVRNYVPMAVTGWTQWLRIINTGSIAADVKAQVIDESTGLTVGTPATIITGLKAGAAKNLDSTAIEAAIGAQAATARPRIRITAATNGMNVQNFLFTPNGSFTESSGAQ